MGRPDFEELQVYRLSEKLANEIWKIVMQWDSFSKDTVAEVLNVKKSVIKIAENILKFEQAISKY
ncbi:MAG: hypothetical protein ACLBM6_02055 [Cuspidothrix sp.]